MRLLRKWELMFCVNVTERVYIYQRFIHRNRIKKGASEIRLNFLKIYLFHKRKKIFEKKMSDNKISFK